MIIRIGKKDILSSPQLYRQTPTIIQGSSSVREMKAINFPSF